MKVMNTHGQYKKKQYKKEKSDQHTRLSNQVI